MLPAQAATAVRVAKGSRALVRKNHFGSRAIRDMVETPYGNL